MIPILNDKNMTKEAVASYDIKLFQEQAKVHGFERNPVAFLFNYHHDEWSNVNI